MDKKHVSAVVIKDFFKVRYHFVLRRLAKSLEDEHEFIYVEMNTFILIFVASLRHIDA